MSVRQSMSLRGRTAGAPAPAERKVNTTLAAIDEKTLEGQMKSLSSTTRNVRAAKKICRNKDTIHTLLDALNTKPKFTKMVEYSLECLKNLAVDEVSIEEMIDEGTLDVLLNVMKLNPYNERIQQMVNKTIAAFCINDRLAALVAERMGSAGLVFSMKKHVEPETLSTTCIATGKLIKSDSGMEMFVKGGVVAGLKHVVHTQEQNVDVLVPAIACLDRICISTAHCADVMESGVVADVLNALKHYPENATLVGNALSMLARLAAANPAYLEELKKMGAVDVIVAALEMHPDDERLNALGAAALRLLASSADVSNAFKVTAGNTQETANALSKLASLLLVDENVDFLINNEGVAWLISALQQALPDHSDVASKILISGCRALMRLATDEQKIYSIMSQGGVKLLVSIVEGHIDDENVVVSAIAALAKMVTRKENAVYIVKSGGVRAAVAALNAHPNSDRVAKVVLELLSKLAAHEETVAPLMEAGVPSAVLGVLKQHPKSPELARAVINTLGRMALSADNVAKMAEAGVVQALVALLAEHKDNIDVARPAILLLESCALLPKNIDILRSAGAMDAILGAMEAHPADADLQAIGSRTLAMIAGEAQLKQAVDYVAQLSEQYIKNPSSIQSIIAKLFGATKLVSNLAMIDANLAALQKNGAVRALVSAFESAGKMPVSVQRSALLAQAVQALLRLAKDPATACNIVQSGALKGMLAQALKEVDNDELAQYTTGLAALCAANPSVIAKMVADGNIESLIALAKAHPLNEAVLAAVTRALGLLAAQDEETARRICMNGGAEIVVESILANLMDKDALLNALAVMNALAVDDACIQKLLDAGAIDAILDAMRAHPSDPDVLSACMQTLCRLLISEQVAKDIGTKGGLPLCVKAMRDHYAVEPLCEIDMILLDSLATTPDNVARLLEEELATIELVKWIGSSYTANAVLTDAMNRLLASLKAGSEPEPQRDDVAVGELGFDQAKIDAMVAKFKGANLEKAEALRMLNGLLAQLQDPKNAELMLKNNGLQTLADLMAKFKDDEDLFYAAASGFLALTEAGGDKILDALESAALLKALCSCINAHEVYAQPMNLTDLTKAIASAARLKLKPAVVGELLKNKPLDSLMRIMTQSDDPLLLQQAARLLSKLSNNSDAALLLSKLANLRELIQALRRNMPNAEFLKYGVYLLGNLALNDDLKSQIGIEGGIQVILQIMDTHPLNEGLVENCCFALAELSYGNEVNVSFIVACKGVQLLLNAMHAHPRATDLLDHAVSVLCNLCQNNNNNKDLILRLDGAQAIVDTVLNNFQALEFLQTSFRTLGNLAYDAKSVTAIIKAGGVQGLVAGMTVHNEDMEIIDVSIRVLSNLAQDATQENMMIMASEGAVQAIVEAAANFTDKLDIEIAALGCLCNLGRERNNAAMIIKQGGTEATIQAMATLGHDATLMAAAFRLLNMLAHSQPAELDKMHEAGITAALVAGLKKQSSNRAVLAHAMSAFALLSYNTENAERMGGLGVLQVILKLVQDNIQSMPILMDCFPALSSLARSEGNAVSMSELIMAALSSCITNPQADARFLNVCFAFLANLCVHAQATEGVMRTQLVVNTLAVLQTRFTGVPDVLIRGLKALENMCFSTAEVKEHLKSCGVVDGVNKISADNAALDDVKRQCKAVIDALLRTDFQFTAIPLSSIKMKDIEVKSAKALFGDDHKKIETVTELPESVRNLLLAGSLMIKHSNTAAPRQRHVYVTPDLKFIVWKDPKERALHPDNKMKVIRIRTVERGRCTPQLERKSFGKFLAKEECAWAILGRDRTIDLESPNEAEREKWVHALEMLIAYRKELKRIATQFHL